MLTNDQSAEPSQTAFTAAAARAAHRIVDGEPRILDDTLAATLLGDRADELISYHLAKGGHPILAGARAQVACRARFTEDRVDGAGHDQYVILGAGLDTFAYRSTVHTRVFEVDHPATQHWKQAQLAAVGIAEPPTVHFVPVDFEHDPLLPALVAAGFDPDRPAVVSWLGVSMYLTRTAVSTTLAALATFAPDSEIVLDYYVPPPLRDDNGRLYAELVGAASAERGEPWLSCFTPDELTEILRKAGWTSIVHIGQRDLPALAGRGDALRPSTLSMLAHARR